MRLPHEQYIRFLITSGLDSEETNDSLIGLELPECSTEYWDKQYNLLMSSRVPRQIKAYWKTPKNKLPKDYLAYMNTLGLKDVWMYNIGRCASFPIAVDALKDEDVCITTRCLLTLRLEKDEISALMMGKFSMNFPVDAVALFEKYFYQPQIMSRVSWTKYMSLVSPPEKEMLYLAITGKEVELRARLELPNRISVSENYQRLHIFAMEKFGTYLHSSDPNADQMAMKFAALAMSAGDKYEKLKMGDVTDFGKDLQMEFEHVNTEFPMIGEESLEEINSANKAGQNNEQAAPIPLAKDSDK